MPESSPAPQLKADIEVTKPAGGGWKITVDPEDILALGALIVVVILAIGIVFVRSVPLVAGGEVIVALVGGSAIAQVVKARRKRRAATRRNKPVPD